MTEQEKVAAKAPADPKAVPGAPPSDPKQPYPTGNPPSADDEKRRATGLPEDAPL